MGLTNHKQYLAIGVMTGTSLDAMDMVACAFTEKEDTYTFEIKAAQAIPISEVWRERLMCLPTQSAEVYAKTHVYFGHYLGENIQQFIKENQLKPDFVAVHGQTIFHQPHKNFTAQIGDGETMVTYVDCPLVCNFRNKDVAMGGQGAPLVPMGEKYLFEGRRLFLNLGGFANVTYQTTAFDVVPCNIVLNMWIQTHINGMQYDENGAIAAQGTLIEDLFAQLNALQYFKTPPPKSLGWEWVVSEVLPILQAYSESPVADVLATYCEHIAFQVARALTKIGANNETLLITGGGGHNAFLMSRIEAALQKIHVSLDKETPKEMIDFKEAIVFAFLGLRTLTGKPNTLIEVTGATQAVSGGSIHLPVGWATKWL